MRKFLWAQVPSRQIVTMLLGRSTDELERIQLVGVEMVVRPGGTYDARMGAVFPGPSESWTRVRVTPGVELHLSADLPRLKQAELRSLLELLKNVFPL